MVMKSKASDGRARTRQKCNEMVQPLSSGLGGFVQNDKLSISLRASFFKTTCPFPYARGGAIPFQVRLYRQEQCSRVLSSFPGWQRAPETSRVEPNVDLKA